MEPFLRVECAMDLAVIAVAVLFAGMGLVGLWRPAQIGRYFSIDFGNADARNEVRAVYGGFGLAMAAALLLALGAPDLRAGILSGAALALAGMAAGRVVGALIERPGLWPLVFFFVEAIAATALWAARG